ncbi:MAG: MATE family efflux transporter [bacterium]
MPTAALGAEIRATLRLAAPLALAFATLQLLTLTDTAVAGHLGASALAAVGLGHSMYYIASTFPAGVMLALDPLVAQAIGAGRPEETRRHLASARRLALWLTLPATLAALALTAAALALGDLGADTRAQTWGYLLARLPSIWPYLVGIAQRSVLQSWGRLAPFVHATLIANLVNVPASVGLGFGDRALTAIGLPAIGLGDGLGVVGIGLASTLVAFVQVAITARAVRRLPVPAEPDAAPPPLRPQWRLGWPVGLQYLAEVGIFGGATAVMGVFGETPLAAGQITFQITTLGFCACLGIGNAAAVRVGLAVGAGDTPSARRAGLIAAGLGLAIMGASATALLVFAPAIAAAFTPVPAVQSAATVLLRIAAAWQLFDAVQAVMAGALRGAGDTRAAMIIGVVGYWIIGVPVALGLAFGAALALPGLYWGLVVGLAFSAVVLAARFLAVSARPIAAVAR